MADFEPELKCSIPWCGLPSEQPAGMTTPHHFCSHHWNLATPEYRARFEALARRRRQIEHIWVHGPLYDEIVKRGHFLKLCQVTLWAKELEDDAGEALRRDIIRADREATDE